MSWTSSTRHLPRFDVSSARWGAFRAVAWRDGEGMGKERGCVGFWQWDGSAWRSVLPLRIPSAAVVHFRQALSVSWLPDHGAWLRSYGGRR
jgi:hypothetical protein